MHKFKIYKYDISFKIVLFLNYYNQDHNIKFKITSSALNRLDKFFTILTKVVFFNSCLIALNNNVATVNHSIIGSVTNLILRGYEINIDRFKQDYHQITNPLNDFGRSSFQTSIVNDTMNRTYRYSHLFKEPSDQILLEIIDIYGENKITKCEEFFSGTIVSILLFVLDTCVLPDKMEKDKEYIINNDILYKVANSEDIIKIDNVLGGNDILKFDVPQFEDMDFKEIGIDDLIEDIEDNIESKYSIIHKGYKRYPNELDELVID